MVALPTTHAAQLSAFLDHLQRGGHAGYYWTVNGDRKVSHWWNGTGRTQPPKTGNRDNLYFGVFPTHEIPTTNAKGEPRASQYLRSRRDLIASLNCLFSEFDAKDYGGNLAATFAAVEQLSPRPSVVVASGGGYHCYWLFDTPWLLTSDTEREHAKNVLYAWVDHTGGDGAAKDLARVLRLPGSLNYKYTPPRPVQFVWCELERLYSRDELIKQCEATWARQKLDQAVDMVRNAPEGKKHLTLLKASRLGGGVVDILGDATVERELYQEIEPRAANPSQAARTIQDGISYGRSAPLTLSSNSHADSHESGESRPARFIVRSVADMAGIKLPGWILIDEVVEGGYHLLYGASGSGKTFYALDRALRLAATGKYVLYIATEDLAGLKARVTAWRKAHPTVNTATFSWLDMPEGLDLTDHKQVDELLAAVQPLGFNHFTIDTLREAHTGDENSSQDGAAINRAVQALIRTGASVDVVHHSGVEDKRPRGTTAVFANADMVIRVSYDGDVVTVHTDKVRNSVTPDDRRYVLVSTETELTDTKGQPIISAVIRPASAALGGASAKLTRAHRTILEVLAYSIFAETGAKAQQLIETTELARRTIYQALSDLYTRKYIVQGSKGDPYTITDLGRAQLGPAPITTPQASAEVENASESPSATSADEVQSSACTPDAVQVQVQQVQCAISTALACTTHCTEDSPETYQPAAPFFVRQAATNFWEVVSTDADGHVISEHRTEAEANTAYDKYWAAMFEDTQPTKPDPFERVNWPTVLDYLKAGNTDKVRSWCRAMWKVDPDLVLVEAYQRWPEFQPTG